MKEGRSKRKGMKEKEREFFVTRKLEMYQRFEFYGFWTGVQVNMEFTVSVILMNTVLLSDVLMIANSYRILHFYLTLLLPKRCQSCHSASIIKTLLIAC